MSNTQARKQRRSYEKFLKKNHPEQYKEYKSGVKDRGNQIHQENVKKVEDAQAAYYENVQGQIINKMKSEGKTQEEIDSYLEDWALTLNIWGSDEKPLRARELRNKNKK
tara:strand:- start:1546 stop:1872 length:327 start_codon:yes stop_codon:yes gene_type:complete